MKNMGSIMAAYIATWAIFFVYYSTVASRVSRLRDDVERLKQTLGTQLRR